MPFYEYQCNNCGHHLEAMQKINDSPLRKCPDCGKSQLTRLMSAPVFRLKGGGWYETDFKGDQDNKKNLADRPEADGSKDDKASSADAKAGDAKAGDAKGGDAKAADSAAKDPVKPAEKAATKPAEKAAGASAKKPAGGVSRRGVPSTPVSRKKTIKKPPAKAKRGR